MKRTKQEFDESFIRSRVIVKTLCPIPSIISLAYSSKISVMKMFSKVYLDYSKAGKMKKFIHEDKREIPTLDDIFD
ncbi:MAG: hypothetical protein ACUVQ1_07700 [Candidatus Kapaibacteriales bacterium]